MNTFGKQKNLQQGGEKLSDEALGQVTGGTYLEGTACFECGGSMTYYRTENNKEEGMLFVYRCKKCGNYAYTK